MQGTQLELGEPSNSRKRNRRSSNAHLSNEETNNKDDSFDIYCQPTELYNILMDRAQDNPSFLNRSLDYRIKARNKRIKIKLSASLRINKSENVAKTLYVCVGRQTQITVDEEGSEAGYEVSGELFRFETSAEIDGDSVKAKFMLPDLYKFAEEANSGSLYILVFTIAKSRNSSSEANGYQLVLSGPSTPREFCLCGKASVEDLYSTWDRYPSFASRRMAETVFTLDLAPCYIKLTFPRGGIGWILSVQDPINFDKETPIHKLQVQVSAEEYGAKEKYPYLTYSSRDITSPEIASIVRLRERSVVFNYRYHDNQLIQTEVTNDFSCPVCLVRCGSYKGIRYHMESSHDYFEYEFWADQVINVSIKPEVLEVITSAPKSCFSIFKMIGDLSPKHVFMLRNARLCKRQFYHSVKYQPMSLEELMSGDDSEGEIDEDTQDIEHRKVFTKLVEDHEAVSKEEKEIMFMWSSFVRRQRVVSDCHIPWACKTFTTLHSNALVQSLELNMSWRMVMIKLWKHNLIDGGVMNECSLILEEYLKQNSHSLT